MGAILFGKLINKSFDYIMVPGPYQYEYARKLGFQKQRILFNNLSANSSAFSQNQNINYDKTFLYVGRNHPVKSIDFLVNTWKNIENKKGWRLHLVGCKSFQNFVSENHSIISTNFISGDENF